MDARGNSVGSRCIFWVRDGDAELAEVQRVVDEVHLVRGTKRSSDPVDRAREAGIRHIVRRFPYLSADPGRVSTRCMRGK